MNSKKNKVSFNKYLESFEMDNCYHIFSHSNGKELLFIEEKNYYYFLNRLKFYVLPIADIYAYCLMPNHFHLLLRFKNLEMEAGQNEHKFLMQKFSNFMNSYAKAINKMYGRRGALFVDYLKRKKINDEGQLLKTVHYIHNNPVKDGFADNCADWIHSSYNAYISGNKKSDLDRKFIWRYFDDEHSFVAFHKSIIEYPELDFD